MILRDLFVAEGQAKTVPELLLKIGNVPINGFILASIVVVAAYKPAAAKREPKGGINVNDLSVHHFRSTSVVFELLGNEENWSSLERALFYHHAGSSCGNGNGNDPVRQAAMNVKALNLLNSIPEAERDSAWNLVRGKVYVSLVLTKSIEPTEQDFRAVAEFQLSDRSKDSAGIAWRFADWLAKQGRLTDAIAFLTSAVDGDTWSAANQVTDAQKVLARLQDQATQGQA